jgi:fructose-1-phosphate kinase PfkB-like protein
MVFRTAARRRSSIPTVEPVGPGDASVAGADADADNDDSSNVLAIVGVVLGAAALLLATTAARMRSQRPSSPRLSFEYVAGGVP